MVTICLRKDCLCSTNHVNLYEYRTIRIKFNIASSIMNKFEHKKHRNPLFLQMLIAGVISIFSISVITCVWLIFSLMTEHKLNFNNIIEFIDSFLFGIIFFCVPISLSLLLFIHFIGLFKYVMYSVKMVVFESSLFILSNIIGHMIIINMSLDGYYFKTILLFSVIIQLLSVGIIKDIFRRRYFHFQKELENCNIQPNIDRKIDIILTIATNIVILIPSLCYFFILF